MQSFVYGNRAKVYQVVSSVTNVSYTERGGEGERERERTRTRKLEYWRMVALGPFGPVQQPVLAILQAQISTTRDSERERERGFRFSLLCINGVFREDP